MSSYAENLARFAYHKFLNQPATSETKNQTCWVVVDHDEKDVGMDVTYHMVREYYKDQYQSDPPEGLEIHHDSLPTLPGVNPANGRVAFVLSQPNHIPTVQTTMQGGVSDMRKQGLTDAHRNYAKAEGMSPEAADRLEEKYLINAQDKEPTGQRPHLILLDQKYPMWGELKPFVQMGADLYMTDRVEKTKIPDNPAQSGRYEPAE